MGAATLRTRLCAACLAAALMLAQLLWAAHEAEALGHEAAEACDLSDHGSDGHVHLPDRIVDSYAGLIDTHPRMAGRVAKDVVAWKHWGLVEPLREIAGGRAKLDYPGLLAVGYCLGPAANPDDEQLR